MESVGGLITFVTDRWKGAVIAVVGLLALSAVIAGYSAWNSSKEANAVVLLRKAVSLLEANSQTGQDTTKQEEGVRLLQEVVTRYAQSAAAVEATLRLGTLYYTGGKYDEARSVYTAYLGKNPRGRIAFSAGIGVGDTYLAQRNYAKAVDTYSRLIEQFSQEPLLPEAHLHLARAYLGMNRLKDAGAVYEKLVAAHPNTGWARSAQGELYRLSLTSR
jgi:TolA-binding protein